jgi:tetratricopeptide (TPR) repeat protein
VPDTSRPIPPVELFFSYAHEDEALRDQLGAHLSVLIREKVITEWHDRKIDSGSDWAGQIDEHINSAGIILLLVSPDFLASRYCYDVETKRALERHEADEARVIPVILRPCDWTHTPLGQLQALPKGGKPVKKWENLDEALHEVARGIRRVVEQLNRVAETPEDTGADILRASPSPAESVPGTGKRHELGADGLSAGHESPGEEAESGPAYDVLLCSSSADEPMVEALMQRLRCERIRPRLEKRHQVLGGPPPVPIESVLADCASCAVCIGTGGLGTWFTEEMQAAIEKHVGRSPGRLRVIPVLLPGAQRPDRGRLPNFLSTTTWAEFRRYSLDDPEPFQRLISGIRGIEPGLATGPAPFEGQCPYRGLEPFDEAHAPFFFGRKALTEWLLDALRPPSGGRAESRFLAIIGPSGSGKSSLALAGLVPALRRGELGDGTPWPVVICRPGYDPLESLAVRLAPVMGREPSLAALRDVIESLEDDPRALHLAVRLALRDAPPAQRLVILVDQFEEVFTLSQDAAARQALIDNLLNAASIPGGQTVVVLTLRADFFGKCASYPGLAAALSSHQMLVGPMTEDELSRAIERPAQLAGCELETGLTEILLQDVERQAGALPLLQYALRELWQRRHGRRLTVAAYRAIGGLGGALENRANAILGGFEPAERELCRRIFLRLTQPGEGTEDTKRRARIKELVTAGDDGEALARVVQQLVDARLITAEANGDGRPAEGGTIEVAHEALIRGWRELRQWIEADRAGLRTHHRLAEAAREWDAAGRHPSYLHAEARLAVAREWAAAHRDELNALESEFLAASNDAERQREAAEIETARRIADEARKQLKASRIALASVLLAVTLGGIALWSWQSERSRRARMRIEAQQALALARSRASEARRAKDFSGWEAAVQAAERALGLARSGVGPGDFLDRIQADAEAIRNQRDRAHKDSSIRLRLEEARIQAAGIDAEAKRTFNLERVTAEYRQALRDYGIDLDKLPNPDFARIIRTSEIRETLTATLDDLADSVPEAPLAERIRELAHQATSDDPTAMRDVLARRDRSELRRKAASAERELARFPPATLVRLGAALRSVGDIEEAVTLMRRARHLHPNDFWINFVLADVLSELRPPRYEEAVRYYTAASALRPDSPAVHYNTGFVLQKQGDIDAALTCYDTAIQLNPKFDFAYNNRGLAWYGKKEYDKAIADFNEALRLDPQFALAPYNRGNAWYRKKEYGKAIADYSESIRLDPKSTDAYNSLAWLLATCPIERFRDGRKAVEFATKACELSNYRSLYALDTLGAAYAESRQFDQAIQAQDKAIGLLTGAQGQEIRDELHQRRRHYVEKKSYREEPQ